MVYNKPTKCPKCHKALIKANGQGYDVKEDKHSYFILARACFNCKIIYVNPNFSQWNIINDSEFGH